MRTKWILAGWIGILAAAGSVQAGVVFEIEVTDHGVRHPKPVTIPAAVAGEDIRIPTLIPGPGGPFNTLVHRPGQGPHGTLTVDAQGTVQALAGVDGEPRAAGLYQIRADTALQLDGEPSAEAYEVLDADGVRRHIVWCVEPGALPGGAELAAALQRLGSFPSPQDAPGDLAAGLFVFDLRNFGGRVPIGVDTYEPRGERVHSTRLRNLRVVDGARVEDLRP